MPFGAGGAYTLKYPATKTTESVLPEDDNDWVSITNIGADDGVYTSITAASYDANDISYRAKAQGFGFALPSDAVVDGIIVQIERKVAAGSAVDYRVQLLDETGSLVGDNKADTATAWPAADTMKTYGDITDLWGWTTTTADKINNANFGVVFSVKATGANTDIYVDYIRVTVYTGAIEDFTTYTEVDTGGFLASSTTRITATNLTATPDAYYYSDKGVDHFNGDFEHLVTFKVTSGTGNMFLPWMVANDLGDRQGLYSTNKPFFSVDLDYGGEANFTIYLREFTGTTHYTGTFGANTGTIYYLKIKRDEAVGTYGTLYLYIYDDAARTNLLSTPTITLHDSKKDWRYIYGMNNTNDGGANTVTGYSENLDLQEAGETAALPAEMESFTE